MEIIIGIICAAAAAAVAWFVCAKSMGAEKSRLESLLASEKENSAKTQAADKERYEMMLKASADSYESRLAAADNNLLEVRKSYDSMLSEIKKSHEKALAQQVEAIKTEMTAQTEAVLKAREEELGKKAEETFKNITGTLGKDLEEMKKSFNENKKAQTESSASLKEHLENAVKNLKERTEDIGNKADNLADALRGKNKMQGCFGEMLLENLLVKEGFTNGVDYDRESTLRDESGMVIPNEDSGKRKVDLKAFSDWSDKTKSKEERDAAAQLNLKAIKGQIDNLSKKDYSSYIASGRKSLDYVLMYVPIYGALQLAKNLDDNIWREAFKKNVLITTEETLVPFIRMIRTAWCNVEQVRNQQNIIKAAEEMIARVHDLSTNYAKLGKKLEEVHNVYEACDKKLKDSGQSIIVSANKVISYGVKPRAGKDKFPTLYGHEESDADNASDKDEQ